MIEIQEMSNNERNYARIIKLTCLCIIALAVIYLAMDRLEAILIPFFLALALAYLLTPLIEFFSCKNVPNCACRLPRGIAVILSFMCGLAVLLFLGIVILEAVSTFKDRSHLYRARMEELLEGIFSAAESLQTKLGADAATDVAVSNTSVVGKRKSGHEGHDAVEEASEMVVAILKDISITDTILHLLGTAAHVAEDLMCAAPASCHMPAIPCLPSHAVRRLLPLHVTRTYAASLTVSPRNRHAGTSSSF